MSRRILVKLSLTALGLAGLGLVVALVWWKYAPRETPEGQPPLVVLDRSSLERLRDAFNAWPGEARILVLLSPT